MIPSPQRCRTVSTGPARGTPCRRRAHKSVRVDVRSRGGILAAALDLVLPRTCAGCDRPGEPICTTCRADLAALALERLAPVAPHPAPSGWPGCSGTIRYEGVSARLMKAFKDGGRRDLADPLARLLADAVASEVGALATRTTGPVLLVPIPSAPAAVRERGERPTRVLARRVARELGPGVVVAPLLSMTRSTVDQAGLGRAERQDNLRGAMRVRRPEQVAGRACVLLDDVLTSGATLSEGRRALCAAGAARVGMAVCMVTPRRSIGASLPFRRPAD